jgi:hypothetical protein
VTPSRRTLAVVIGAIAAVAVAGWLARGRPPARPAPRERPDIVLVSLDTVRPDHLSGNGYRRPTSPDLDRLAAEGVVFERCTAQAPWTLPSHMSLFTSLLPSDNGVDNLGTVLDPALATLPELLAAEGYRTAGIVNDAQMRAHWGFARGFDTWQEYAADTPEGAADRITARALEWLGQPRTSEPRFLFLHYYDAHDPYEAPAEFRRRFGVEIDGRRARELCFAHRSPAQGPAPPAVVQQIEAAYDAEIAALYHQLGRLFAALDPETLVVVFSDHGECFGEHGWMLHGATLTEPDVGAVLIVRPPRSWRVTPRRVAAPVALLDVAPTLLACGGAAPHPQFTGVDLTPLCRRAGFTPPPRLIPAETKAVLEGRYLLGVAAGDVKAVYSLFDGCFDLVRLPGEQPIAAADAAALEPLLEPLRRWIRNERYWLFEARGPGEHETIVHAPEGPFSLFIPAGLDPDRDVFDVSADGRRLTWRVHPEASGGRSRLLVRTAVPDAPLEIDYRHDGRPAAALVRLGPEGQSASALPVRVDATLAASDPLLADDAARDRPLGLTVTRHAHAAAAGRRTVVAPLEGRLLEQLRSLGYVR